jgi:hypothetical protein
MVPSPEGQQVALGLRPLIKNPASAACTPKRMKAAGFRTSHALPHGNALHFRQSVQTQKSGKSAFLKRKTAAC